MTGFEAWVKMGLELGAREILAAEDACEVRWENWDAFPPEKRAHLIADELQSRWPPWRREKLSQADLPGLFAPVVPKKPAGHCSHCGREANLLLGSAEGALCRQCFDSYMRREWP